ncbi:hypothetical protein BCY91_00050 [Pelobium manganitolerans]|uniref:DUF4197 domain-containing protein n=1 Tax=Pelobium manganitolerans TaxID=1842495 RepID=A0A419SB76_9SPHI|nr:DUF4197 domain-containing protein [Pelobium manganitolerans]RKD20058.1 hypothetical protein BCY91_00050 [Pelobium manganitolerans]
MKKFALIGVLSASIVFSSCDTLNQYSGVINQALGTPSTTEMSLGLKQALEFGTNYSSERLAAKDGFLGNMAVKILFPEEARKVETALRSIGLDNLCDNVIVSLNRAAEDAAKEAKPIFVNAIKQMSFQDVTNILLGQENAATLYFKRTTSVALADKFKPVISSSLSKVGATKYWGDVTSRYNKLPLVKPINTDLAAYVTDKAIDGMFVEIAQEELKIRQNLSARSTSLLQKVFAYADQQKGK